MQNRRAISGDDIIRSHWTKWSEDLPLGDSEFQPFYVFPEAAHTAVVDAILPRCDATLQRKRKRRPDDEANFRRVLEVVIANALMAFQNRGSTSVYYSRKNCTFSGNSPYYPSWLRTTNLKQAVDGLANAGLLTAETGQNDKTRIFMEKFQRSTFTATPLLTETLWEMGISADDVFLNLACPTIYLKDADKKLIDYNRTDPDIVTMGNNVRRFNSFIVAHEIQIDLPHDEIERLLSSASERDGRTRSLNLRKAVLRRIFNNSDFNQGGRWFGGWWIVAPSEIRPHILIDGQKTIELDYSGFLTRALYHSEGIDYQDDPYDIPEIFEAAAKQGLDLESVRTSIKLLINININAKNGDKVGKISGLTLPKGFKELNKVIYPLIYKKHDRIAHHFRSGDGLRIMRRESNIAERILMAGIDDGILVLPVHDSFLVQGRHEGWLWSVMHTAYQGEFGFDPIIKKKDAKQSTSMGIESLRNDHLDSIHPLTVTPYSSPSLNLSMGESIIPVVTEDDLYDQASVKTCGYFEDQSDRFRSILGL